MAITWRNTGAPWSSVSDGKVSGTAADSMIKTYGKLCFFKPTFLVDMLVCQTGYANVYMIYQPILGDSQHKLCVIWFKQGTYVQEMVDLPSIHGHFIGTMMTMMVHHQFITHLHPIPIFPIQTESPVELWLNMYHVVRAQSPFLVATPLYV